MNLRKGLAVLLSAVMVLMAAMPVYAEQTEKPAENAGVLEMTDSNGLSKTVDTMEEATPSNAATEKNELKAVEPKKEQKKNSDEEPEEEPDEELMGAAALKSMPYLGAGEPEYFYIQAEKDKIGVSVRYRGYDNEDAKELKKLELEVSTDGVYWESYTIAAENYSTYDDRAPAVVELLNKGDGVYFRAPEDADNGAITVKDGSFRIVAQDEFGGIDNAPFSVGGDITTLIEKEGGADIPSYFFKGFFEYSNNLINSEDLVIPADVELSTESCSFMFHNCTKLETAPDLSAETLAKGCYAYMFKGCTKLETAPALPAETLAESCYESMFYDCSGLETAPELPAETLAPRCYAYMFDGCTKLVKAPELPAETLAESCYMFMFDGCMKLVKAPELPAETLAPSCYFRMFRDCKNLETAPELPAGTLAEGCYEEMFLRCSSLNEVKVGFSSWTLCTRDWLKNTAENGTFYATAELPDPRPTDNDDTYVPTGWAFPHSIKISSTGYGTASSDQAAASKGDTVKLTASPGKDYHFVRWESADVEVADDGTFTMPGNNVSVTAVFGKTNHTVTVVTSGGGSVNVTIGDIVELSPVPFTGWHFDSWTSDDVTVIDNKFEMPAKNVTVNARFDKDLYTVCFDTMGGSEVSSQTVAFGERAARPASPSRSGYSFAGWYADAACTKAFDFDSAIVADKTIYAKWNKESSSGGRSSSGRSSSGASAVKANALFTGTWGNPVRNGHWSLDDTGAWRYTTTQLFTNTWAYIFNPYAHAGQHEADWFRFDANGIMLIGWQLIDGKWYYLNPTKDGTLGACFIGPGSTPDGYEIDASGAWTGR